ncbi:LysE family translocator [Saccharopolyspora shandongensis]|uniref:Threonine/homoserine/homoserine lactone efflux protein n=1 Tax=Saccharopolyspora shandongensis TaxID=418495 RepID=A0A1H3ES22_9PSEU|nr:LysE family translocator [Saccharopolyspora shandongensis]SDX81533.1 Threonine/homoserine/homoserine lactone efflux protein [Saccharopolyspora shandongensis]
MVSVDRLLVFAAMSLVIIAVPGPSVLFVVGRALAHGKRTALTSVVGNAIGCYLVAIAVALGVGAVVAQSIAVFTAIKVAGAVYLIYLGIKALRSSRPLAAQLPEQTPAFGGLRTLREGVVVGVANPKTFIFFTAVVPQFVDPALGHVPVQMLLLALIPIAIALISDSAWGLFAATARNWLASAPRRLAMVQKAGGFAMIGLGLSVAVTGRKE